MVTKIAAVLMLTGCAAHLVKTAPEQLTLGKSTGRLLDDKAYLADFKTGADEVCPHGYTLVERGRQPASLAGQVLDEDMFYWVIRCK